MIVVHRKEKKKKKKRCLVCWCTDIVDFEYKRGSDVSVTKLIFGHTIRSVVWLHEWLEDWWCCWKEKKCRTGEEFAMSSSFFFLFFFKFIFFFLQKRWLERAKHRQVHEHRVWLWVFVFFSFNPQGWFFPELSLLFSFTSLNYNKHCHYRGI